MGETASPPKQCKKCSSPLKLTEFWSTEEIKSDLEFALSQKATIALVADSNELVGFTWGYQVPLNKFPFLNGLVNERANYMDEIAVDGNARKRGIGKLLGQTYIDKLTIANVPEIVLRTDQRNTSSMNLFKSLGFESMQVTDPDYNYRIYLRRILKCQT
ncbi:MAG: GNAT family N-acetyltransferase [Nanoarchaeota archaeon]